MPVIWIVYEEWQTSSDGDSAVITSVHRTKTGAERAAAKVAKMYASAPYHKELWARDANTGRVDPDHQPSDWELDVHVESREVEP